CSPQLSEQGSGLFVERFLGSRAPNGCLRLLSELLQEPLRPRPPVFAEQRDLEIPFKGADRALLAVQCELTVHDRLGDGIEVRGQGICLLVPGERIAAVFLEVLCAEPQVKVALAIIWKVLDIFFTDLTV